MEDEKRQKLIEIAALSAMLEKLKSNEEIKLFSLDVEMTKEGIQSGFGVNGVTFYALGDDFQAWFDETVDLIYPIMNKQSSKLNKMLNALYGDTPSSVEITPPPKAKDFMKDMEVPQ